MTSKVFWPTTGLRRDEGVVVGWREEDVVVVVGIVEEWMADRATKQLALEAIGRARSTDSDTRETSGLRFIVSRTRPVDISPPASLILFDPPDPVRLRYLTCGRPTGDQRSSHLEKQDSYGVGAAGSNSPGMTRILQMLNRVRAAQRELDQMGASTSRHDWTHFKRVHAGSVWLASAIIYPLALVLRPVFMVSTFSISGIDLQAYSATLQQLALRSRQLLDGPSEFRDTLHDPAVSLGVRSVRYVKFWNTVWLILNDLVLGYCARELVELAIPYLARTMPSCFQSYLVEDVVCALAWLDDWPVGLKLNTSLSRFFRITFTTIISAWSNWLTPHLVMHARFAFRLLRVTGYGGLSLFLAVLRDTIALITLHLRLCHTVTLHLVRWQLASLGGLWNLFRGKKWNVLRQRTDSYAYDVDQLFLGTLLFTVSAFLFPTVLTYAALFALIQAGLWLVDQGLRLATAALNAFPLFEVLLRLKEPSRLPDGLVFKLSRDSVSSPGHYLELHIVLVYTASSSKSTFMIRMQDASGPFARE